MDTEILVISHDEKVRQLMQMELDVEGYSVLAEADITSGFITLRKTQPKLLILDEAAPGLSSIEVCRRLQTTNPHLKIILVIDSERAQVSDWMADDYIFKPFNLTELLLRVRLKMRWESTEKANILRFEDLSLCLTSHEVYRGDRRIELTPKEFDLLSYLLRHPKQVIGQSHLLETIWNYDFSGNSNVLHVCISSLRNKLESAGELRLVQTVRGVGYVLKQPIPHYSCASYCESAQ
ncbi:MAG: response regulator transcription factor [Cyanobacteriota bacterium]|nr:response regulator transcription factor [Cyanobacteriota bacterium]